MDSAEFWQLIDGTRAQAKDDAHFDMLLEAHIQSFSPDGLKKFKNAYVKIKHRAFTWKVWGAAYLMNNGCSDDCFSDFLAWLISQGQELHERTLRDPDSLAEFDETRFLQRGTYSNLGFIAEELYEKKIGECWMPASVYETGEDTDLGEEWNFDDRIEMEKRYPKLFKKYRRQRSRK
jgi:hypothetical protein